MIRLISGNMLGMEVFIVLWELPQGEFRCKGFTSVVYAREFIIRKFKQLHFDDIRLEMAKDDLTPFAWLLHRYHPVIEDKKELK